MKKDLASVENQKETWSFVLNLATDKQMLPSAKFFWFTI